MAIEDNIHRFTEIITAYTLCTIMQRMYAAILCLYEILSIIERNYQAMLIPKATLEFVKRGTPFLLNEPKS